MNMRLRALTITGMISFVFLSVVVVLGWIRPIDQFVAQSLAPLAGPIFVYVTELGSVRILIGLSFLSMLYFLWKGDRFEAFRVPVVVITTLLLTQGLKLIFGVERPTMDAALDATTYSFPSGHASGSLALYGLLAILVYRRTKAVVWLILLIVLTLAVSLSRVVLNVHYFSDVVGGWIVAFVMIAGSEFVRRKQY